LTQLRDFVQLCEELSDAELLTALGSALDGSGLNVSPVDPARLARFARRWLDAKAEGLWKQIQGTETYRIWAATAGSEQVIEADDIAASLAGEGVPGEIAASAAVAMWRDAIAKSEGYDVAVSCAERQSDYAGRVVSAARALELRIFFDKEMTYVWWGKNFLAEGRRTYGRSTRHFVPFISAEYLTEPRPRDAFESAMSAAFERGDDYILPVLVGDVSVPPEMLHPAIGYLRAEEHSPAQIAAALRAKVAASKARAAGARDIGVIVRGAYADRSA
jgi:hypothetical protein